MQHALSLVAGAVSIPHHILRNLGSISVHFILRVVLKTEETIHSNPLSSTKSEAATAYALLLSLGFTGCFGSLPMACSTFSETIVALTYLGVFSRHRDIRMKSHGRKLKLPHVGVDFNFLANFISQRQTQGRDPPFQNEQGDTHGSSSRPPPPPRAWNISRRFALGD